MLTSVPFCMTGNGNSSLLPTISSVPYAGVTAPGISPSTHTMPATTTTILVHTSTIVTVGLIVAIITMQGSTITDVPNGEVGSEERIVPIITKGVQV